MTPSCRLDNLEADDLRLIAGDIVTKLRTHRKRAQLRALQVQVDQALAALDTMYDRIAVASRAVPRRSKAEMVWKEKGAA